MGSPNQMTPRTRLPKHSGGQRLLNQPLPRSLDHMRRYSGVVALLTGLMIMTTNSCELNPNSSKSLDNLLARSANHTANFDPHGSVSAVVAARFTSSGSNVVVLDAYPPFIKIFDSKGIARHSFLNKGGGPEEMFAPYALATRADSLLLIVDVSGRASEYTIDGRRIASARLPVRVLTAAACETNWLLYGLRFLGEPRRSYWLHEISFPENEDTAEVTSIFPHAPSPDWAPAFGRPHGLTEAQGRVTLVMDFVSPPLLAHWSCAARHLDSLPLPNWTDEKPPSLAKGGALRIPSGTRVSTGVARIGSHIVLSAFVLNAPQRGSYTVFRVMANQEDFSVTVPGSYVLLDTKPHAGVLLADLGHDGRLFTVDGQRFLNALSSR